MDHICPACLLTLRQCAPQNTEETEKAKRVVADERQDRKKTISNNDEEHLAMSHCEYYLVLEAIGMPPQKDQPRMSNQERTQMATDEIVCLLMLMVTFKSPCQLFQQVIQHFKKQM